MMGMVSGWEWLILMGGLVVSFAVGIVLAVIKGIRGK